MTASVKFANTTISIKSDTLNWANIWKMAEYNRYGIISMLLLLIGCLGGAAAAFSHDLQMVALAGISFSSMTVLTLVMAVQPMKWIVKASAVALAIDAWVILVHFFG